MGRRVYNSFAEIPYQGWRARQDAADRRRAAKDDPEYIAIQKERDAYRALDRLRVAVTDAVDKRAQIEGQLRLKRDQLAGLEQHTAQTGYVSSRMMALTFSIAQLAKAIPFADQAVIDAENAFQAAKAAQAAAAGDKDEDHIDPVETPATKKVRRS